MAVVVVYISFESIGRTLYTPANARIQAGKPNSGPEQRAPRMAVWLLYMSFESI